MNATELAAWWGAAIASLVLVWDIFKWKWTGPILKVSASPDMQPVGEPPHGLQNNKFVTVEVTNTGDRKTTLTHLVAFHYASRYQWFRGKKNKSFIVAMPAFSTPLPQVLDSGERWVGGIEQNEELEEISRNGYLYCGVYHSSGKRPVLQRVIIRKQDTT